MTVPANAPATPKNTTGAGDVDAQSPSRGSADKKDTVTPTPENDEKVTVTTTPEMPGDNDADDPVLKVSYLHCSCLIVDEKTRMDLLETGLRNVLEKLNKYETLL